MDRHRRTRRFAALGSLLTAVAVSAVVPSFAPGQNPAEEVLLGLGLRGDAAPPPAETSEVTSQQPRREDTRPGEEPGPGGQRSDPTRDRDADATGGIDRAATFVLSKVTNGTGGGELADLIPGPPGGNEGGTTHDGELGVLSLFGLDRVPPVEGGLDETGSGLFGPIQRNVLEAICAGSGGELCLSVIAPGPEATALGSLSTDPRSPFNGFDQGIRPAVETSQADHWLGDREALALVLIQVILGLVVLMAPNIMERYFRPSF